MSFAVYNLESSILMHSGNVNGLSKSIEVEHYGLKLMIARIEIPASCICQTNPKWPFK